MTATLSKFAALVAAAVLALPPGMCCGMAVAESATGASAAEQAHSCCQAPQPEQSNAPAQPVAECCCGAKAVTKADSAPTPDAGVTAGYSLPLVFAPPALEMPLAASPALFSSGPPLRILLCVWRN